MNRRPLTDAGALSFRSGSSQCETLESRRMPIVGGKRGNPLAGRLAFWRNFALFLLGCNVLRLAADLIGMLG